MKNAILSLGKQSVIYGLGDVLYKAVAFFLLPVYLKYLSPAQYGTIESLMVTRGLAVTLIAMGLPNAIFRFYYRAKNDYERKQVISTIFFLSLSLQISIPLIFWWQNDLIADLLFKQPELGFFVSILTLNVFLVSFRGIPLSLLRAKEKAWNYTIVNLSVSMTTLFANIYFVVYLQKGVVGVLFGNLCGGVLGILMLFPCLLREIRLSLDRRLIGQILAFSVPLALATIPLTIIFMADRYFIAHFAGLGDLGVYAIGYKISSIITLFVIMPFLLAWGPFVFSIENKKNVQALYSRITTYYVMVGLFFVVLISVFQADILRALTNNKDYYAATNVIPILCYAFFFYGLANVIRGVGIRISGKTYFTTLILSFGMCVNLLLNYFLIKLLGYQSAAYSILITFIIVCMLSYKVSTRIYPVAYEKWIIIKLFCASVIVISISKIYIESYSYKISTLALQLVILFIFVSYLYFAGLSTLDRKKIVSVLYVIISNKSK